MRWWWNFFGCHVVRKELINRFLTTRWLGKEMVKQFWWPCGKKKIISFNEQPLNFNHADTVGAKSLLITSSPYHRVTWSALALNLVKYGPILDLTGLIPLKWPKYKGPISLQKLVLTAAGILKILNGKSYQYFLSSLNLTHVPTICICVQSLNVYTLLIQEYILYLRVYKPHFFWQELTLQNWGAAYTQN
jgi:hypothetical protein